MESADLIFQSHFSKLFLKLLGPGNIVVLQLQAQTEEEVEDNFIATECLLVYHTL